MTGSHWASGDVNVGLGGGHTVNACINYINTIVAVAISIINIDKP